MVKPVRLARSPTLSVSDFMASSLRVERKNDTASRDVRFKGGCRRFAKIFSSDCHAGACDGNGPLTRVERHNPWRQLALSIALPRRNAVTGCGGRGDSNIIFTMMVGVAYTIHFYL